MLEEIRATSILLLIAGSFAACGKDKGLIGKGSDDNSADSAVGQFLSAGTFAADGKETTLTSLEAVRALNSKKVFYNEAPKSNSTTPAPPPQQADLKCAVKGDQVTSSEHALSLFLELDSSSCLEPASPESTQTQPKSLFRLRLYIAVTCSDTSIPNIEGKTAYDLIYGSSDQVLNINCDLDRETTVLSNLESNFEVTTSNGTSTSRTFTATMDESGQPCIRTSKDNEITIDGCGEFSKAIGNSSSISSTGAESSTSKTTLYKTIHRSISGQSGARYFSRGKFDLTFNNWTGSMTYSGPFTAPVYSITDGKQSANGSYTGPMNAALFTSNLVASIRFQQFNP